jgi:hypothetical protein
VARFQSKVRFLIVCEVHVWHEKMSGDMTYEKNLLLHVVMAPENNLFDRLALYDRLEFFTSTTK